MIIIFIKAMSHQQVTCPSLTLLDLSAAFNTIDCSILLERLFPSYFGSTEQMLMYVNVKETMNCIPSLEDYSNCIADRLEVCTFNMEICMQARQEMDSLFQNLAHLKLNYKRFGHLTCLVAQLSFLVRLEGYFSNLIWC